MSNLIKKACNIVKEDGIAALRKKSNQYLKKKIHAFSNNDKRMCKDVLFIDGCGELLLHPSRYRVVHQIEQLQMNNLSCDSIYVEDATENLAYMYRVFVIFRCAYNEQLGKLVQNIHDLNKKVYYDIDDLVIDTVYTDQIPYLNTFSLEERKAYNDNVMAMGKMLKLCDGAITSTEALYKELVKYVPTVFINRNTASEQMVKISQNTTRDNTDIIRIGYFSGSITHNDDFEYLLSVLDKVLHKYENVQVHIVGELDIPNEIKQFENRVIFHPFLDWKKLPQLIASVDINIVPLLDSVFNQAKSENKWIEASLVKTPTIASNVGAFSQMIHHGQTGFLCSTKDEWEKYLSILIESYEMRKKIGEQAYDFCMKNCITAYTGNALKNFLRERMTLSIGFVVPGLSISGGMRVILKHAIILKKAGIDVSLILEENTNPYYEFEGEKIPILCRSKLERSFDKLIATMWTTAKFVEEYPNVKERFYLVQNFETDFYEPDDKYRIKANATYSPNNNMKFLTISRWCQNWLWEQYGQNSKYAPNGIDESYISPIKRNFNGKIRILIEGDNSVQYKNVDESFKITNTLDPHNYDIWYMSYNAKPKEWYRVDRFLHKIPYGEVVQIYQQCHILLKTSILESFSYPPLEMMATGGYVVAVPNGGNSEYLVNGYNCILYDQGNIQEAVEAIKKLSLDEKVRDILYEGGLQTAKSRSWNVIEKDIIRLYLE